MGFCQDAWWGWGRRGRWRGRGGGGDEYEVVDWCAVVVFGGDVFVSLSSLSFFFSPTPTPVPFLGCCDIRRLWVLTDSLFSQIRGHAHDARKRSQRRWDRGDNGRVRQWISRQWRGRGNAQAGFAAGWQTGQESTVAGSGRGRHAVTVDYADGACALISYGVSYIFNLFLLSSAILALGVSIRFCVAFAGKALQHDCRPLGELYVRLRHETLSLFQVDDHVLRVNMNLKNKKVRML